jgi:hypothetical protein
LFSNCRACGNLNALDGNHRAGAYLIKANPKDTGEMAGSKGSKGTKAEEIK